MSLKDLLKLDDFLCFALYSASRSMTQLYRVYLEPRDLTYPQFLVLFLLWKEDGRPVSAISDTLFLDGGTVTPLLKRMEAKGLIRRQRSVEDERVVQVFLSEAGRALEQELLAELTREMLCDLEMDPQEVGEFAARVHELRRMIDRAVARRARSPSPVPSADE